MLTAEDMAPRMTAIGRRPRLMGVFAHPDDEIFCAGGTLARWAEAGCETLVLSATRGEAGQIQDGRAATRATLGAVREGELRAACALLGVRRVECLDYPDGGLAQADGATLAAVVAARIAAFAPDVVITFGPDGATGHPDHIAISAATTRACSQIARATGRAPRLVYSAFPRQGCALHRQLGDWLEGRDQPFIAPASAVRALALLADEAVELGYASDAIATRWYPSGVAIVEQGEAAESLHLIISGHAEAVYEEADGTRRVVGGLGPGHFFGAEALTRRQPQEASLIATETVTCLVLAAAQPTPFDGRGPDAWIRGATQSPACLESGLAHLDVAPWLDQKIAALAAHRTQFALEPEAFPSDWLADWLGQEYFTPATLALVARPVVVHWALAAASL